MNIALIGPSGVGKGTYAGTLVEKFNLTHLVTGELLRQNLQNRTAVGFLAKRYLSRGELVPDEVVDAMVAEWLWHANLEAGVLFDGFPRTIYQAHFLDELFAELGRQLDTVIYLRISDEAVKQRIAGRVICKNCQAPYHLTFNPPAQAGICDVCGGQLYQRPDDIPEMVRVRLRAFRQAIGPVLDYYHQSERLIIVDGEGELDQILQAIVQALTLQQQPESRAATGEKAEQIKSISTVAQALSPEQTVSQSFDLVLVGGPGSGKGTQAEQLKTHLKLPHIASGDLFRENLKNGTDLGKLAKTYMDRGDLVPDDVTEAMVEERVSRPDTAKGFILDGFPRTLAQAQALTEILNHMRRQLTAVLYIRVSDEEIVRRLSGRLICRNCQSPYHLDFKPPAQTGICDSCGGELYQRDDDNPKTVRARLKTFRAQTTPIIDYYKELGILVEIDGQGDVAEVTDRTLAAVQRIAPQQ